MKIRRTRPAWGWMSATDDPARRWRQRKNNVYHVTVKAEVLDQLSPRDAVYWTVKVTVANVNEKPVFPKATDTRKINENLDDPNKEPDGYLLNRGVGTPIGGGPIAPNLDVGRPVVAEDDDNNSSNPAGLHWHWL